ncbi:hypothetical protein A176_004885 [Myxococcus hansupus]|uniref:Uncharacterized protein n=1 Tax=Pseudomyxococcus hansupus TaxID=1297742 RepID=A0A0H4X2A0_9BACT|nr:hypothetical protein [Myxococcus hansupus]AKQ67973.1 hypothetical protein A176_004885 [Myxococcus hansupus]
MNGPDSGMALGVGLGMLLLLVVGGAVGFGAALLIKKLFNLSMLAAVGVGVLLVVVGGVGLFAVVFDDLTSTWWAARTAKPVHFTVPKGFHGQFHLVFDPNGPAVNEVKGKLEVPVGEARVQKVKAGVGLDNDYAQFEAHDTEGTPVDVFLDSSGSQNGLAYRGFWFGDQTGRTYGESPILPPE